MPADTTEIRGQIARRLPWLTLTAVLLFGLDCYQSDESVRTFLVGAIILLPLHGSLFLAAFLSLSHPEEKRRRAARSTSYAIVVFGALWVVMRFLTGDWIQSSAAYLDAFMIGGLSGSLYFFHKPSVADSRPVPNAGADK